MFCSFDAFLDAFINSVNKYGVIHIKITLCYKADLARRVGHRIRG